jgi:multiple sugar transport system permease protein
MSAFDWKIGSDAHFVGFGNYATLATNQRFLEAIVHTFYFTVLAVVAPLLLGNGRRDDLPSRVPVRGRAARDLHHADDGDPRWQSRSCGR